MPRGNAECCWFMLQVRMLNYKADGTSFQNSLHVAPIRCSGGKVCC